MEIKQTHKMAQKISLTPQMRQSLHILELALPELKNYVDTQMEENPALAEEGISRQEAIASEQLEDLIEQQRYANSLSSSYPQEEQIEKRNTLEGLISKKPTLEEHLLKQLTIASTGEKDIAIGRQIIAHIDRNGYLTLPLTKILANINKALNEDEQISRQEAENTLQMVQAFDPPGIGAKNLRECLLIQLRLKNKKSSLAYKIVDLHLPDLMKNRVKHIAQKLKIKPPAVASAAAEISRLNPRPGKAWENSAAPTTNAQVPDVIIRKIEGGLETIVNTRGIPRLHVSNYYLKLARQAQASDETKEYIKEKLSSAAALIRSIQQREDTIRKIVAHIVKTQKDFFEHGDRSLLKPLVNKTISQVVKRNESTVSRVISNKYIETPYGTFKMDFFLSKSLPTAHGPSISSEAVKQKILDIIEDAAPGKLNDAKIVAVLNAQGIKIARRTVAKYRGELDIPARQRGKKKG